MTDWSTKSNAELATARENALAKLHAPGWAEQAQRMLERVDQEIARRGTEPSGLHPDVAARIREETGRLALADRVARAFRQYPAREAELRAIRSVHDHPGSTSRELTAAAGWPGDATWHLVFGTMCARREPYLPPPPPSADRAGENFYTGILCDLVRPENRFYLKSEAVAGLKAAGTIAD